MKIIKELQEAFNCEVIIKKENDINILYVDFVNDLDNNIARVHHLDKITKFNRKLPKDYYVRTKR